MNTLASPRRDVAGPVRLNDSVELCDVVRLRCAELLACSVPAWTVPRVIVLGWVEVGADRGLRLELTIEHLCVPHDQELQSSAFEIENKQMI